MIFEGSKSMFRKTVMRFYTINNNIAKKTQYFTLSQELAVSLNDVNGYIIAAWLYK